MISVAETQGNPTPLSIPMCSKVSTGLKRGFEWEPRHRLMYQHVYEVPSTDMAHDWPIRATHLHNASRCMKPQFHGGLLDAS